MHAIDVVILGAGAAGLMCAITAGRRGRRVVVLDHARQAGEKILISGGGRCNFTNLHCTPERFLSANPHFCRSALARYTPRDFLDMVERHRIAWHEKTLGQLFCDGSARQIVAMLLAECAAVGADIRLQQRIGEVSRADRFRVETDAGPIEAASLVLATGGLSIPKLGATGLSHDVARRFGLELTDIRPGLVPLLLGEAELSRMAGRQECRPASVQAVARRGSTKAWWSRIAACRAPQSCRFPRYGARASRCASIYCHRLRRASCRAHKRARPKAGLRGVLGDVLPQRLADVFLPPAAAARPIGRDAGSRSRRSGNSLARTGRFARPVPKDMPRPR